MKVYCVTKRVEWENEYPDCTVINPGTVYIPEYRLKITSEQKLESIPQYNPKGSIAPNEFAVFIAMDKIYRERGNYAEVAFTEIEIDEKDIRNVVALAKQQDELKKKVEFEARSLEGVVKDLHHTIVTRKDAIKNRNTMI